MVAAAVAVVAVTACSHPPAASPSSPSSTGSTSPPTGGPPVIAIAPSGPPTRAGVPVRVTVTGFPAERVELRVDRRDGPPLGTDSSEPYDFTVPREYLGAGSHTLVAEARGPGGARHDVAELTMPASLPGCHTVTYTPPTAPNPYLANLCVPASPRDVGIVLVHGGGGTRGSRAGEDAWSRRYLEAGYVTLSIDYFLFDDTTPAPVYPEPERDVKSAIQYLRRNASNVGIDPDRIVVQGSSAGARLSAEMLVSPDDPYFDGPERWPGVSDRVDGLIAFYGPYDGAQAEARRYYGGGRRSPDPAVQDRRARANSVANAADASGPALLFQGDQDERVPVGQMTAFADALRAGGQDVEAHVVAGGGHGYDNPRSGLTPLGEQSARQALAWLAAHFPS